LHQNATLSLKGAAGGANLLRSGMPKARVLDQNAPAPVFPAPDHDHDRCMNKAMAVAEAQPFERGRRLTSFRRHVLATLLGSHQPLGAYEIMNRVSPEGSRLAPTTVYRALDFLRENGLVHRIESRNAFVACMHTHSGEELVVFLICERCGAVGEASAPEVAATLKAAARTAGFTPKSQVIEISGACGHCQAY